MKRLLPLLLIMLLFLAPAMAEDVPTALFLEAHPGYEIAASDAKGDTAAAILTQGAESNLCIAERVNGAWTLTIDNPKALLDHEARNYELLVDTDNAVYWHCQPWDTQEWYGATKENGTWQMTSPIFSTAWGDNQREIALSWCGGNLCRTQSMTDENGNILSTKELMPLPASWLDGMTTLADFDISLLPTFQADIPDVMEGRALELAAKELLPDYTYIGGSLLADELQFLLDKPDGTRVFMGVIWDGDWRFTESAPLPADTRYGNENFTDYLYIPSYGTIGVRHWLDGSWAVDFLMPDNGDILHLGQNYICDGDPTWAETLLVGDHPWCDLTVIDWSTLPHNVDEARAAVDNTGWAMVNNPNPEDRLHIRVEPDRTTTSDGKYYNGAFGRVLERQDGWAKVDIFGREGWMMTDYLAFGEDMESVQRALMPQTVIPADGTPLHALLGDSVLRSITGQVIVLGINGDWFHVWLEDTGESGYVRQDELWGGNG